MQWASSITMSPARASIAVAWRANLGLARRSGEMSSTSSSSRLNASRVASQSSMLAELMVAAFSPARPAASIWSRMSASRGEITKVGPAPSARSADVAAQYTADLPQPVACTTSTRERSTTRARTAARWSSRGVAAGPAMAAMTESRWASARAVRSSWVVDVAMGLRILCAAGCSGESTDRGGLSVTTGSTLRTPCDSHPGRGRAQSESGPSAVGERAERGRRAGPGAGQGRPRRRRWGRTVLRWGR